MESESELTYPEEVLRQQIATNEHQLYYLHELAASQTRRSKVIQYVIVLIIASIGGLVTLVAVPPDWLPSAHGLGDLAGVLFVFLVFALVQAIQYLTAAHSRSLEIRYYRNMQEAALEAAYAARARTGHPSPAAGLKQSPSADAYE